MLRRIGRLLAAFAKPIPQANAPLEELPLLSQERWLGYLPTLLWALPTLGLVFWVHWQGFEGSPVRLNGDAGIYASQTWAVVTHFELAPFTYFYDHPPGAWLTMAAYTFVTRAFQRDPTTLIAVRESMLVFHMISSVFLFGLARRLRFRRGFAALAVLLFSISPLGLQYQREAFIDNVVVMWLLAGLFFAAAPRRGIVSGVTAGFCFAAMLLSKETALAVVPGVIVFVWLNTNPGNRRRRLLNHHIQFWGTYLIYYACALAKHELFPGPGHVSLVGTFEWQLVNRKPTGSLLNIHSQTFAMAMNWVHIDPVVLVAGVALTPLALLNRRTFAFGLMMVFQLATVCRDGYMPYAYVTLLFPLGALIVAGVGDNLWSGFNRRREVHEKSSRLRGWAPRLALGSWRAGLLAALTLAIYVVFPLWQPKLAQAMEAQPDVAVRQAVQYLQQHVPRNAVIVTDNDSWTDVAQAGYHPSPIDKLQLDPAVREKLLGGWKSIQFVLTGDLSPGDRQTYSITATAIVHSVVVARFGHGDSTLYLRRVVLRKPLTQSLRSYDHPAMVVGANGPVELQFQAAELHRAFTVANRVGAKAVWA